MISFYLNIIGDRINRVILIICIDAINETNDKKLLE